MAYLSLRQRIVTMLMVSTVLVSCSVDGMVPPHDVDATTRVGSISRSGNNGGQADMPQASVPQGMVQQGMVQQDMPPMNAMSDGGYQQPYPGDTADPGAPNASSAITYGAAPTTLEAQRQQISGGYSTPMAAGTVPQGEGIDIDAMVGAGSAPVVGLAQEQALDIAEGYGSSQPVIGNIGSDQPVTINAGTSTGGFSHGNTGMRAQAPQEVAMLRPDTPLREPRQSAAPAMMPQSEISCRAELRRLGVGFKDVPPISNGPTCGINHPLELFGLSGGVAIKPSVKLNCQVTLAFAKWVKFELAPSARYRYLSGVGRITPMGGYSCRKMNSRASNPWSEHARGNAIDIGTITLKNGKTIDVRKKGIFSFREKGLLKAVRTDSCKYFSTVLGPGSDASHWNHFHFDLRTRKSGYRHCD